jgi:beta-glucosidase
LSYTDFSVSNVSLSSTTLSKTGEIRASVTVKNTGKVAGATTVQLYIRDVTASISRPVKELKGFEKIDLQPGEEKRVTFTLREKDLRFFDNQLKWASEPGKFNVFIGLDSVNVKENSFQLK